MAETFVWKTSTCFERLYQKKIFFYLLPSFWSIHRVRIVHVSGKETSQFCQAQNIEASFFRSLWCTCTLLLDVANIFVFLQKSKVSFTTFQKSFYGWNWKIYPQSTFVEQDIWWRACCDLSISFNFSRFLATSHLSGDDNSPLEKKITPKSHQLHTIPKHFKVNINAYCCFAFYVFCLKKTIWQDQFPVNVLFIHIQQSSSGTSSKQHQPYFQIFL